MNSLRIAAVLATALSATCGPSYAEDLPAGAESALQARYREMKPQWPGNAMGAPLTLNSREGNDLVEGEIHAEVEHGFARISTTLKSASRTCDLLFLHLNVRSCRASAGADGATLALTVGPKLGLASSVAYSMAYKLRVEADTASYLRVSLNADEGPLSTRDYHIVFEAVPIGRDLSFVHVAYSYRYGMVAGMAMQAYLATAGRSKIGFTVTGKSADGKPLYVRGERASLERNVMRNYLALVAYVSVDSGSPLAQMEARLRAWFGLTERYAAQLHEFDLGEYLREKHQGMERMAVSAQ